MTSQETTILTTVICVNIGSSSLADSNALGFFKT